jgi:hypothetical protein
MDRFDWRRVAWGHPDSPVRPFCAYCSTFLPQDSVPLMLWREDGAAARFCDKCAEILVRANQHLSSRRR